MPLWTRCSVGVTNINDQTAGDGKIEDIDGGRSDGGSTFEGIVRNVASLVSDKFFGYFRSAPAQKTSESSLTALYGPSNLLQDTLESDLSEASQNDREAGLKADTSLVFAVTDAAAVTGGDGDVDASAIVSDCASRIEHSNDKKLVVKESPDTVDIDEILSSTLGALYGRATPAAVKQAWEVLNDSYGGDVNRFKSEFLNPVLELLHRVQEIQDTGEFPNSTWPLSVGSSVVVHLTRKSCRYLRDIGDFCISVVTNFPRQQPGIVVSDLTFDGVAERAVGEQEFGLLLTMDWARKVREAADHELIFVLRQCMVASEYTIRHLRWDEIPQLDPRNLRSARLQGGNPDTESENDILNTDPLDRSRSKTNRKEHPVDDLKTTGVGNSDKNKETGHVILDTTEGESSTDPLVVSPVSDLTSPTTLDDKSLQFFHSYCDSSDTHQLSQSYSCSIESCTRPDVTYSSSCPRDIFERTDFIEVHHEKCLTSSPQSDQNTQQLHPPQSSALSLSLLGTENEPKSASTGSGYYGTWHGSKKSHLSGRKMGLASRSKESSNVSDPCACCHHKHVDSSRISCGRGAESEDAQSSNSVGYNQKGNSLSPGQKKMDVPECISQVDNEILCSGVAILPGCVDEDGRYLVYIFTCSSLWHERRVSSTELARLLMYYYTVPRKKSSPHGMTIVADIRGATPPTINTLLESLSLLQDNVPGSVSVVHLFTDKTSQLFVIKSPLYNAKENVNVKMLLTYDHLLQYVKPDQIPTVLDGECPYNHESWVRFRKKLEPFMSSCRSVACRLVDTMQEVSSCQHMPQSMAESSEMISAHEQIVKSAFEDEDLILLQNDGPAIISSLRREEESFVHSEDYRFAMEQATELNQHLQDTITRLARLADTHLSKLHNCLQLREYEDECHKVIDWLSQDGESILQKHATSADNLRASRHQQRDFEKFYFSAMSYIEKGNDLLEEASMLSQCGSFSEATGYKDLAKTLRRQLQCFTGQLEEARERIEGTAKCYYLLDKSYEWALEAMKYVSSMKMEHSTTAEGLDKLIRSLTIYLSEHPPVPEESFAAMLEAASRLNNDKLLEQCRLAKERCQETYKLLQLRQTTLRRARDQMAVDKTMKDEKTRTPLVSHSIHCADRSRDSSVHSSSIYSTPSSLTENVSSVVRGESVSKQTPFWNPQGSSTPMFSDWRCASDGPRVNTVGGLKSESNRSLNAIGDATYSSEKANPHSKSVPTSASAKIPLSSSFSLPLPPSSAQCDPIQMSQPASPTFSLSESPVKTRLYQPTSSISRMYNSSSSSRITTSSAPSGSTKVPLRRPLSQPGHGSVCNLPAAPAQPTRPHKKILKRAITAPVPMLTSPILEEEALPLAHSPDRTDIIVGNGRSGTRDQRSAKSISMITSSTESLPSMPEEDEEDLDMSPSHDPQDQTTGSSVKDWTPVPVNTHLHRSARGTPTGPMSELRLSEAEMKSRRTVSLILSEMIQTERDYVRALQFITDHYVPELLRDDVPQMLRGKRTIIFGNLEKIHQFHSQYFLKQLEACQNQPFLVGQYFLQHETMFYLYALYNKNKPKSDCLMMEYGKDFFRQKQLELGDKMDLSSYLLKPVQRMGKYALLLKQLLKECSESELEYPDLKAAEEMVRFQLRHGNDLLAMDSLRDCDVNLQEQGRLLRQEEFLVFQGRKKSMRRIFIFEDLILFSKTRRGRQGQHDIYIYKTSFKTADIGLTENYGDSGYKFEIWFRRRSVGENYVLQAPSSEVKKAWVKDISRLLWRQAIRNRESRINELATMGIGNKPCLDIKPSEDNIQDRSINVALGSRGARTRNSIAVSSFDYLRNGNKRPHSIISVSSTSSSGSSQSSFGLLGSLNLAFDPLDSPRLNRRSFLSNESGIVTDGDTSGTDPGRENRVPAANHVSQTHRAQTSPVRSYFDVMKSRVLKQKYSDQLFTDV